MTLLLMTVQDTRTTLLFARQNIPVHGICLYAMCIIYLVHYKCKLSNEIDKDNQRFTYMVEKEKFLLIWQLKSLHFSINCSGMLNFLIKTRKYKNISSVKIFVFHLVNYTLRYLWMIKIERRRKIHGTMYFIECENAADLYTHTCTL